jgi:protein tyrosine phosphatase (PTP) superfamily phosphohydrolase (DUF442 family)
MAVLYGCVIGSCAALAVEGWSVLLGRNLHTVIDGKVYRSAQLSGADLEKVVRDYGIRTVINLRGCADPLGWYLEESRATHRLGISQEDVSLSSGRLPSGVEMRRLLRTLDKSEYPILLHCRRGADRTGLTSAMVLLLEGKSSLSEALRQISVRYGHVALGRPASLDHFFDFYKKWLDEHWLAHSSAAFRQWIEDGYHPGRYQFTAELIDPPALPVNQPSALHVRLRNQGDEIWQFRPGSNAGIRVAYILRDPDGKVCVNEGAGLFRTQVPPGQSIDLTLAFPPLKRPGRYHLLVDPLDDKGDMFHQIGLEPLECEVMVRSER